MKRREFLTAFGAAAGTLALARCNERTERRSLGEAIDTSANSGEPLTPAASPDIEIALRAGPGTVSLLEGQQTAVWQYSARLLRGPRETLDASAGGYLGPTLRVRRGQRVRIHFENAIGEPTIIHWHGLYVSERNDGHPSYVIRSGERYVYDFRVDNRAGTYWYHPHPADRTGPQVYKGLAGLLLVSDEDEKRLDLPDGDREITLVLQDRSFDVDNRLIYQPNQMIGFLGDQLLVNGEVSTTREVSTGPHRLRILNGSNSRVYDLAWSDGSPVTVIGTDGGLLGSPRKLSHVVLAPGQRLDVWANFGAQPGEEVWLESRGFSGLGPMMGMMGRGMMMGRRGQALGLVNGAPLRIQRFVATGRAARARPPDKLVPKEGPAAYEVSNAGRPRAFTTSMHRMQWFLNGRTFEMRAVAQDERVRLGSVEDWEFSNPGGHMGMAHPIHLHGPQFRIIARSPGPGARAVREGILDEGWLDTFLLLPGDRVRLRVRFDRHPGMFLYHCHNLEHEDMGMMRNYLVEEA